jgi:uncharacterized membrane protein YjdF
MDAPFARRLRRSTTAEALDVETARGLEGEGTVRRTGVRRFDIFLIVNAAIIVAALLYSYRILDHEFALYGIALLAVAPIASRAFRKYDPPALPLVLITIGVALHFLGGLLVVGDDVLYGAHVGGLYFDKLVHAYNGFAVAVALAYVLRLAGLRLRPMEGFIVVMCVVGLGAVVEIVEYIAVLVAPQTNVGDYANNLLDLVANTLGATLGYLVFMLLARAGIAPPEPGDEAAARASERPSTAC